MEASTSFAGPDAASYCSIPVAGDRIAEPQLVEDRAERGLIVHRGQYHIGLLGLRLRLVAVDPRRRRHVEPARAGDVRVVVDPRERGLVACIPEGAGGAVRLVADDQVERAQPLLLSAGDHVQRLVGREHHRHRIGHGPRRHARDQVVRAGGGWKREVVDAHVLVAGAFPGVDV